MEDLEAQRKVLDLMLGAGSFPGGGDAWVVTEGVHPEDHLHRSQAIWLGLVT